MNKIKVLAMPCEVYSRVVGYYRPVQDWHEGKRQEFADRKMISLQPRECLKKCHCDNNPPVPVDH